MSYENRIEEYKNRHKEWRDITVNQLSNVNNVFTSLSIGFFAFVFNPEKINNEHKILWFSLFFLILSITFGLLILLTRLYDFRISRHLAMTRQKTLNHYNSKYGLLPDNRNGEDFNSCDRFIALFKIILCKIEFVSYEDIEKKDKSLLKKKFERLQELSDVLGSATWKWLKLQVLFFMFSIFLYGILIFFQ